MQSCWPLLESLVSFWKSQLDNTQLWDLSLSILTCLLYSKVRFWTPCQFGLAFLNHNYVLHKGWKSHKKVSQQNFDANQLFCQFWRENTIFSKNVMRHFFGNFKHLLTFFSIVALYFSLIYWHLLKICIFTFFCRFGICQLYGLLFCGLVLQHDYCMDHLLPFRFFHFQVTMGYMPKRFQLTM